ncbi:MAG: hypothetical protein KatS3mg105_5059 [Gemmatales bacterium]|nr:MAG: hypothetical protein KatS3mg105_5059 [Gemmatales bacterium]
MTNQNTAFGHPGIEPRWTRSDKEAIVTAYSASSRIWATLSAGIVNEVYSPTIDKPQIRDLQFLITDGRSFFHDERRDTESTIRRIDDEALGFRVTNRDREGRYSIEKTVITAPHANCLLLHTTFVASRDWSGKLRLFALLAPHLNVGGWGNSGTVLQHGGRRVLTAHRGNAHLAMDCTNGFVRASCGYVGVSDGWTDLADNYELDWQFDAAPDGNIALTGEVDLAKSSEFTLAVSFSHNRHGALATLAESLAIPFGNHLARFQEQWTRARHGRPSELAKSAQDGGVLLRSSHNLLLSHEDKTCHGAMIASLSIPWGEAKGDEDLGGYHLVWTRDMVHSATGLMAAGETATPLRALVYLASSQKADGGFYQNFWIDGTPYWQGTQLDEVAFPILLAWKLKRADALQQFDPYPMVKAAAGYLVREGPATPQERWEENSGYSPSTLAAHIAALICAGEFAREAGDNELAAYFEQYADFLRNHIERWTVTTSGTILPDVPKHFIRLLPIDLSDPCAEENPDDAEITIRNRAADLRSRFPRQAGGRRRFFGVGPIRCYRRRRAACRRLAESDRPRTEMRNARRPLLATVFVRRIRSARRWGAIRWCRSGTCMASVDRRTGTLRIGGRSRRIDVHSSDGTVLRSDRTASRTGLGPSRHARSAYVVWKADWIGHAADVGTRGIHQVASERP